MIVQHNNIDIEIIIKRSKRKTACIRILPDATVEVRGPQKMTDNFVRQFVLNKADWIIEKKMEPYSFISKINYF